MLKKIRVILAVLSILAVTALFIDVTGFAIHHWPWMAKIQLIPAILGLNLLVVAALIIITLLLGRVYCSVICPLGIYQDIVNRISLWFASKKTRKIGKFRFSPNRKALRSVIFGVFAIALVLGVVANICSVIASLLEPYSAFGRMAVFLGRPVATVVNNELATVAAGHGSYAFHYVPQLPFSLLLAIIASATFLVVTVYAWKSGRGYCNQICPVGTLLGWISKYSWLKPIIDNDKCISCGKCGRRCKASCIDTKNHRIDYTRCVACMDCINNCSEGAISYIHPKNTNSVEKSDAADKSRRAFLVGGSIVAGSLAASALGHGDGGLAPLKDKKKAVRKVKLVPPGAKGNKWLASHCTACQLCISNCPNEVLSPSTDLSNFMQPVMDFSKGYCRPECTTCSDLCPAGAILPIDVPTKSSTKIGTAVVDAASCISGAYGQKCGHCAEVCPAGAIEMIEVEKGSGKLLPTVNESRCIGCGSCEYHCPVGTVASNKSEYAAIHVEGIERHHTI